MIVLPEDEPPRSVWSSSEELVFALEPAGPGGDVLAATGPNGKLYRIGSGRWSLDRTLDEKQVTVLAGESIATNGSCAVYRQSSGPRKGEYVSAVKDTGRTSRFGAFRWEGDLAAGAQADFAFRSGESQIPDATWSPWSAWTSASETRQVAAPPARYLQWKTRLGSDGKAVPVLRRIEAAYRNRNAAPDVESVSAMAPAEVLARAASGSSNVFETQAPDEKGIFTGLEESKAEGGPRKLLRKGYRTLTWRASDRDGDALTYEIRVRSAGSDRWMLLRKDVKETFYAFDTTALPDGDYVFRLIASDADVNPDDPKTAETGHLAGAHRQHAAGHSEAVSLRGHAPLRSGGRGVADPGGGVQRGREGVDPARARGRPLGLPDGDLPCPHRGRRARRLCPRARDRHLPQRRGGELHRSVASLGSAGRRRHPS